MVPEVMDPPATYSYVVLAVVLVAQLFAVRAVVAQLGRHTPTGSMV